jgi:hypothetical protein
MIQAVASAAAEVQPNCGMFVRLRWILLATSCGSDLALSAGFRLPARYASQ